MSLSLLSCVSRLEHRSVISPSPSYFLLIAWTSLSGTRVTRYHTFDTWSDAYETFRYNVWYDATYNRNNNSNNNNNNTDNNNQPIVCVLWSATGVVQQQSMDMDGQIQVLQQLYRWLITSTRAPTGYPTNQPTPLPYDAQFVRAWADMARSDRWIVAGYPVLVCCVLVIAIALCYCAAARSARTHASPSIDTPSSLLLRARTIALCLSFITCLLLFFTSLSRRPYIDQKDTSWCFDDLFP